jgi:hypothetical protein
VALPEAVTDSEEVWVGVALVVTFKSKGVLEGVNVTEVEGVNVFDAEAELDAVLEDVAVFEAELEGVVVGEGVSEGE